MLLTATFIQLQIRSTKAGYKHQVYTLKAHKGSITEVQGFTDIHCVSKKRPPFYFSNNSQTLTNFNDFWWVKSWENLTSRVCKCIVTLDTSFAPRYLSWCTYHWYSPTSALNLHCKTPVFHVSLTCSCMDFAGVWVVNLFVMHTEISYFARNTDACSCFEELHLAKTVCNLSLSIDLIKWTTGRFKSLYSCPPHLCTVACTLPWEIQKSQKLIFNSYWYILQIIYIISEENKLLLPYPSHLKNVTALPCKMHKFYIVFIFSRTLSTNPQYGRVAEASCCHMGWISAERGGRYSWSVEI